MATHKLLLLDAFALLYRSHFAFIKNPRVTSSGMNTSALFGFTNTLLELINKEEPTHFAVAMDTAAPTFRHVEFEAYKANRDETPEDMIVAIPYMYKMLEKLNVKILAVDGYEADDLIGTVATHIPDDFEVLMVTPDKDYAQLVRPNVYLYRPLTKGEGYDKMDRESVIAKFGVPPERIVDFLGMKGDAADNIPGIPKVGDKTALELIAEFGTVENVVANAASIKKNSIRESVLANGQQGIFSKYLATIKTDVPFEWTPDDLKLRHADLDGLIPLLQELEFKTLTQRILNSRLNPMVVRNVGAAPANAGQISLFGESAAPAAAAPAAMPAVTQYKTFAEVQPTYHLVETAEARRDLIARIREAGMVCFDTETTGLDTMVAEIVGLSLSVKAGEAYYLHFGGKSREEATAILSEFAEIFESEAITKIGQNIKYDLGIVKNYGISVRGPMFDTMLAHFILQPDGKHGMDAMSRELLGYEPISIETLIGSKGKKQKSMLDVPVGDLVNYAAEDADITLQLHDKLAPQVKENFVFNEIEQPLMPVLFAMEREGIRIDTEALTQFGEDLGKRMEILEKDIIRHAGEEFNINSNQQLGVILFEKLKLGKGLKADKTKTGQYTTDEKVLEELARQHEMPGQMLAYRALQKLKSTYVDALPRLVQPATGRVHTTFRQTGAVTGRLSSDSPNLQNIPVRSADGREVRRGFIARDADHVLLAADYSQVELRIMAAFSKDEAMVHAFREGIDIHRLTASKVYNVAPEDVTREMRSVAKTVNFGIIYGVSAFGLAEQTSLNRSEAKAMIDGYFATYPGVKAFMTQSVELARQRGYSETFHGRRRYLPDLASNNAVHRGFAERNAINSPIQGTAADIIKLAMIAIHKEFAAQGLQSKMVLQVHDELVFDVLRTELDTVKAIVHRCMTTAADIGVPLEVEMGVGDNWLEAK